MVAIVWFDTPFAAFSIDDATCINSQQLDSSNQTLQYFLTDLTRFVAMALDVKANTSSCCKYSAVTYLF